MPEAASARLGIIIPALDRSERADVPNDLKKTRDALEARAAVHREGTNAERLAAAHIPRSTWRETDTGDWYYDDAGGVWRFDHTEDAVTVFRASVTSSTVLTNLVSVWLPLPTRGSGDGHGIVTWSRSGYGGGDHLVPSVPGRYHIELLLRRNSGSVAGSPSPDNGTFPGAPRKFQDETSAILDDEMAWSFEGELTGGAGIAFSATTGLMSGAGDVSVYYVKARRLGPAFL